MRLVREVVAEQRSLLSLSLSVYLSKERRLAYVRSAPWLGRLLGSKDDVSGSTRALTSSWIEDVHNVPLFLKL